MKRTAWCRITSIALCVVMLMLNCALSAHAYDLPSGYTLSNSYKSGKYYSQLAAVQLTGNQREDIVAIALSQLGYHEGAKGVFSGNSSSTANYTEYNRYAYYLDNAAWCGSFVSWCAAMAGIPTSILPKTAGAKPVYWKMIGSGKLSGADAKTPEDLVTNGGTYIPKAGDLAFFGSKSSGDAAYNYCTHIGLISEVNLTYTNGKVTEIEVITVEGNYSNKVTQNKYVFNASSRHGYAYGSTYLNTFGIPNYAKEAKVEYDSLDIGAYGGTYLRTTTPVCDAVRKLQQGLNLVSILDDAVTLPLLTVNGSFDSETLSAVKKYQTAEKLEVDGIVGSATWNALRSDVIALTKAEKNEYIVSDNVLYAYKGSAVSPVVPDGIQVIAEDAFRYRTAITSVGLPAGLTTVADGAFSLCSSLKTVSYAGTATAYASVQIMGSNAALQKAQLVCKMVNVTFGSGEATLTLTVEAGSVPTVPKGIATEKPGDTMYTYVFAGWNCEGVLYSELPKVTEDCTFVAEFIATPRILNVETLNNLLIALAQGTDDVAMYDFVSDGILNVDDLNALLVLLASVNN